jgi:hypothetical protein
MGRSRCSPRVLLQPSGFEAIRPWHYSSREAGFGEARQSLRLSMRILEFRHVCLYVLVCLSA